MRSSGQMRKRVGLFGGSFNPPHLGHSAICRWLFERGLVDEVWVVPCFIHPFGKELLPFEHRVTMCRLALQKIHPAVRVLEVEKELGGVSYTLRTIEHLQEAHPDLRFSFVTGEDVEQETHHWKQFERIRDLVDVVRVPRGPKSVIPDISSTEIRRRLQKGEAFKDLIEKEVAVYIITKGLFR